MPKDAKCTKEKKLNIVVVKLISESKLVTENFRIRNIPKGDASWLLARCACLFSELGDWCKY